MKARSGLVGCVLALGALGASSCTRGGFSPLTAAAADVAADAASDASLDGRPVADGDATLDGPTDRDATVDRPAEAAPTPVECIKIAGKACSGAAECGGHQCVKVVFGTKIGVCACTCTPDDPATPLVDEDDCAKPLVCGAVTLQKRVHYCFRPCVPAIGQQSPCANGIACDPRSSVLTPDPTHAVCALPACAVNLACPVLTSATCNPGAPTCPLGQPCVPLAPGASIGRCAVAGRCDLASGLCMPRSSVGVAVPVGAPCNADTDCLPNARCELQIDESALRAAVGAPCVYDDECCSRRCDSGACGAGLCGVHSRNGYCTIDGCAFLSAFACPPGSVCNIAYPGGRCLRSCNPETASDCRDHSNDSYGDYECRSWNQIVLAGHLAAPTPVCEWGDTLRCNAMTASGCAQFGGSEMTCRTDSGTVIGSPGGAVGTCLDLTGSGPISAP